MTSSPYRELQKADPIHFADYEERTLALHLNNETEINRN